LGKEILENDLGMLRVVDVLEGLPGGVFLDGGQWDISGGRKVELPDARRPLMVVERKGPE